jgi:hypothetical protein
MAVQLGSFHFPESWLEVSDLADVTIVPGVAH